MFISDRPGVRPFHPSQSQNRTAQKAVLSHFPHPWNQGGGEVRYFFMKLPSLLAFLGVFDLSLEVRILTSSERWFFGVENRPSMPPSQAGIF
jgi:hypothetical protein